MGRNPTSSRALGFGGRRVLSVVGLMVGMSFGLAFVPQAAAMAAQVQARRQFLTIDFPGATATYVLAVNDAGILTGFYNDASGVAHGFVEAGTEVVSFDPPGVTATFPSGINDQGTISGTYADAGGALHALPNRHVHRRRRSFSLHRIGPGYPDRDDQ